MQLKGMQTIFADYLTKLHKSWDNTSGWKIIAQVFGMRFTELQAFRECGPNVICARCALGVSWFVRLNIVSERL